VLKGHKNLQKNRAPPFCSQSTTERGILQRLLQLMMYIEKPPQTSLCLCKDHIQILMWKGSKWRKKATQIGL